MNDDVGLRLSEDIPGSKGAGDIGGKDAAPCDFRRHPILVVVPPGERDFKAPIAQPYRQLAAEKTRSTGYQRAFQ